MNGSQELGQTIGPPCDLSAFNQVMFDDRGAEMLWLPRAMAARIC